jgi:hemin uptake protein HemP
MAEIRSPAVETPSCGPAIPLLRSVDLFGKAREILIEHAGGVYRLRVTHSNKLILTK